MTIDVRHSRVMKRQYLNVLYSPTAAYKGRTEGLCGFMDNNATNDFMGPDGILYNDAVEFAESCKQRLIMLNVLAVKDSAMDAVPIYCSLNSISVQPCHVTLCPIKYQMGARNGKEYDHIQDYSF